MGEIKEKLKRVAYFVDFANKEEAMRDQLDYAGEAIESELQELSDRINNLSGVVGKESRRQDGVIHASNVGTGHSLREQDKHIEALEETVKKLEMDAFLESIPPEPMPPDVPTDKDGKPEGGLEPDDLIRAIDKEDRTHYIGLFHHIEKSVDGFTKMVFAYWKQIGEASFQRELSWRPQSEVTFEFRPRFPDQKER